MGVGGEGSGSCSYPYQSSVPQGIPVPQIPNQIGVIRPTRPLLPQDRGPPYIAVYIHPCNETLNQIWVPLYEPPSRSRS